MCMLPCSRGCRARSLTPAYCDLFVLPSAPCAGRSPQEALAVTHRTSFPRPLHSAEMSRKSKDTLNARTWKKCQDHGRRLLFVVDWLQKYPQFFNLSCIHACCYVTLWLLLPVGGPLFPSLESGWAMWLALAMRMRQKRQSTSYDPRPPGKHGQKSGLPHAGLALPVTNEDTRARHFTSWVSISSSMK